MTQPTTKTASMACTLALFRRSGFLALVVSVGLLLFSQPVLPAAPPELTPRTFDGETYLVEVNQRLSALPHPSVAVAVGGGGARALVNVGVLKALEEESVPVDLLVGTSMGAIIAVLYGSGMPLAEIERLVSEADLPGMFSVAFPFNRSILNTVKLNHFVERAVPTHSLEDFPLRTALLSFDLTDGKKYIHTTGPISTAMQGPYAIPLFFRGQSLGDHFLVDAGIQELTPSKAARALGADVVIAVTSFDQLPYATYDSPVRSWVRLVNLIKEGESRAALDGTADVVIEHDVGDYSFMDFDLAEVFIALGYRRTKESMPAIKAALAAKGIPERTPTARPPSGVDQILGDLAQDRLELDHTDIKPVFHLGRDYSGFKQSLFRDAHSSAQYGLALESGKLKALLFAEDGAESLESEVRLVKMAPGTDILARVRREPGGRTDSEVGVIAYRGRMTGELSLATLRQERYIRFGTTGRLQRHAEENGELSGEVEVDVASPLSNEAQAEYVASGRIRLPLRSRQAVEFRTVLSGAEVVPVPRIYRGNEEADPPHLQTSLDFLWQHPFPHSLELLQILRLSGVDWRLFWDIRQGRPREPMAQAAGAGITANLSLLGLRPAELSFYTAYDQKQRETVARLEMDISF